jgi:PKHD-type hydroxylase
MMHHTFPTPGGVECPYACWDGLFTEAELDALEGIASAAKDGTTVGDASGWRQDDQVRRSRVSWVVGEGWLYERLQPVIETLNARHWGLDLVGFGEAFQATRYESTEDAHYDWHQDFGAVVSRKLSVVIQLTDPANYDGGDLQIMTGPQPMAVEKLRGRVVLFPSYQLHRVTPVTSGIRHSLVAWISGPRFR